MKTIDLHDYYDWYKKGTLIDIADDIAEVLQDFIRDGVAYQVKNYRHKAYYSLDRGDGIERDALQAALSPHEVIERRHTTELLYAAIASLSDKQAKRIYAHYFLGMSKAAIAKTEDVAASSVKESISRGVRQIQKFFGENF